MSNKKDNQADEIAKIKEAKKNKGVYVSPAIISPQRMNELFLEALDTVLNEAPYVKAIRNNRNNMERIINNRNNNNINLNNKGGKDVK